MNKKLLTLIMAIAFIFVLAFAVSATCYEDYEMAKLNMIAEKISNYNPGGNNKPDGEIDGDLETGIAGNWKDFAGTNVIYKYSASHLVRKITITFEAVAGRGYNLYLSNDGGSTWNKVVEYMPSTDEGKRTIDYPINNGDGIQANAFKFEYAGSVLQYNVSLFEISITGSNVVECDWDQGTVTNPGNCGVDGLKTHVCSKCNGTKDVPIPATGNHEWGEGEITVDPSVDEPGLKVYTCSVCSQTKEEVLPATGHTWDNGTVVPPTCTEKGYTLYSCTDDGCEETYKGEETKELGHDMDDGVITTPSSVNTQGTKTYSCKRDDCNYTEEEKLPLATYSDNTIKINQDFILSVEEVLNNADKASDLRNPLGMFDGKTSGGGQGASSAAGGWFAPSGSYVLITFKEEIHVLSINFYPWSNYNQITIEFLDSNGSTIASYSNGALTEMSGAAIPVANVANKLVKAVKVTANGAKGDDGSCLVVHEIEILAHEHQIEEGKEQFDVQPSSCTEYGTYKKTCYVCEKDIVVQTEKADHEFASDCDTICENCPQTREVDTAHTSDFVCYDADGKCNLCGADVTLADHTWEAGCDTECGVCSQTREPTGEHISDFVCYDADGKCNFCQTDITISAPHTTDFACKDADGKCNTCAQDVTVADHTWSGDCDTICNVCSDTRTSHVAHTTDFACYDADGKCNVCEQEVTLVAHTTDYACYDADNKCNVCDQDITIDTPHTTDKACKDADGNCNVCAQAVTLGAHTWAGDCDSVCDICEETRTAAGTHTADFACKDADGKCNVCGEDVTLVAHKYTGDCDPICDVCGDTRTATSHTSDKPCYDADGKCNVCGTDITLATHTYSSACDTVCNVCERTRISSTTHKKDFACYDADGKCNDCGEAVTITGTHTTDKACNDADMKCNVCAQTVTTDAHTFAGDCDTVCDVCEVVREVTASHTYGDWTVIKDATKDADGEKSHTCSVCGYVETVPVVYEGGLGAGAVVGIVSGSVVVAGAGGFSLFWFVIKKKSWADLIAVFKK